MINRSESWLPDRSKIQYYINLTPVDDIISRDGREYIER